MRQSQQRGLSAATALAAVALGSWSLLSPVIPLLVSTASKSNFIAGIATGLFMATTVVTQLLTPTLLRRFDFRPVLMAGCLLMGLPSLGIAFWPDETLALVTMSSVRGLGFGLVTVSCAALPPHLVHRNGLGRAVAVQGMVSAASMTGFLIVGIQLHRVLGLGAVTTVAVVMSAAGALAVFAIPRFLYGTADHVVNEPAGTDRTSPNTKLALATVLLVGPAVAYGGLSALIPVADYPHTEHSGAILATIGTAVIIGRFAAGRSVEQMRRRPVLAEIGALSCSAGLLCFFLSTSTGLAGLPITFVGAALFGVGFGWAQNTTLVRAFESVPSHHLGFASAVWNISLDSGIGVGAVLMGATADGAGFGAAHLASAVLVVLVVTVSAAIRFSTKHRSVDDAEVNAFR